MLIQRQLQLQISHFEVGDYIEYTWFRGYVIGLNAPQLQQKVRVTEVLHQAYLRGVRAVGSVQFVPFNFGRLATTPQERCNNVSENTILECKLQ